MNNDLKNQEYTTQERLDEDFKHYNNLLQYLGADVPIQTLCLPKRLEKILRTHGLIRVYDLIGFDFGKIKGLGDKGIRVLTSRLDEFFSVAI